MQKVEARCVSLQVDSEEENIYTSYADGSIRKWQIETGNCVLHIQADEKKSKTIEESQ